MRETEGSKTDAADPLAEIIRAAGRRADPPRDDYEKVYAAAHATWQRKTRARKARRWYALAAAAAFVALGAALWQSMPTSAPEIGARLEIVRGTSEQRLPGEQDWIPVKAEMVEMPEGTRLRTSGDGAIALRLDGGGSLRLDSDTSVILARSSIELDTGTIYFDSAGRHPDRAVNVVTPFGTVRDIGTQFEVRTTVDALRVRVRSGSVVVVESPTAEPVSGLAGEEIHLDVAGQISRRGFASDNPGWAWAEALASAPDFQTPSVLRYLTWIAEETGRALEFETESVRLQAELARFLGDPHDLPPTELLITISATSDFNCEITNEGTIFISRDTVPE